MKQNVLKLTIFVAYGLYNNQIKSSYDHNEREILRSRIIHTIENNGPRSIQSNLPKNIESLFALDPRYKTGEINFNENKTFSTFLVTHQRFDLLLLLTKSVTPVQQNQVAEVVSNSASSINTTPKPNSSSCKKSSLACAFTCNSSTCSRWTK